MDSPCSRSTLGRASLEAAVHLMNALYFTHIIVCNAQLTYKLNVYDSLHVTFIAGVLWQPLALDNDAAFCGVFVIGVIEHVRDPSISHLLRPTESVPGFHTAVVRFPTQLGRPGPEKDTIDVASSHMLSFCIHDRGRDVVCVGRIPEVGNLHIMCSMNGCIKFNA